MRTVTAPDCKLLFLAAPPPPERVGECHAAVGQRGQRRRPPRQRRRERELPHRGRHRLRRGRRGRREAPVVEVGRAAAAASAAASAAAATATAAEVVLVAQGLRRRGGGEAVEECVIGEVADVVLVVELVLGSTQLALVRRAHQTVSCKTTQLLQMAP